MNGLDGDPEKGNSTLCYNLPALTAFNDKENRHG